MSHMAIDCRSARPHKPSLAGPVPPGRRERPGLTNAVREPVLQVWGECVADFDYCVEDGEEDCYGGAGDVLSVFAKRYLDGRFVADAYLRVEVPEPFDLHPCYLRATLRCAARGRD